MSEMGHRNKSPFLIANRFFVSSLRRKGSHGKIARSRSSFSILSTFSVVPLLSNSNNSNSHNSNSNNNNNNNNNNNSNNSNSRVLFFSLQNYLTTHR
ncbi:hypothetical protein CLOM_g1533 [Closterium sp. NIES-68]|nr:hypothetical protein CLOM_g1533 [Closterium sp. NIES-68]